MDIKIDDPNFDLEDLFDMGKMIMCFRCCEECNIVWSEVCDICEETFCSHCYGIHKTYNECKGKQNKPKKSTCECGVDIVGGKHSSWCPKHEKE